MPIGTQADFKIYHEQFFGGLVEVLEQNANAFNEASNGAIRLVPRRLKGHFEQESFIKKIAGLVSRRDISSVAAATDLKMEQGELVGVKINRKIGPVTNTHDSFRKIARDPEEMSFILGQQTGQDVVADYVNTALAAINAALSGVAALNVDKTDAGTPTLTHAYLVDAMATMGDASNRLSAWVMHSKQYFDLMKQSIADKIFEVAGVTIYQGTIATFNRPTIVLDSPALISADPDGAGAKTAGYVVLGLVRDAAEVAESEEQEIVSERITGLENLVTRIQGEYAFNLKVKGFAWDMTNGGVNPNDAAIATQTNWDQALTDKKSLCGARLRVQ